MAVFMREGRKVADTLAERADDLHIFLPGISEQEYQARARIRSLRNVAAAMIAKTDSDTARQLAWIASDCGTGWLYQPASEAGLADLHRFMNRLLLTAIQAENIEQYGPGGFWATGGTNG